MARASSYLIISAAASLLALASAASPTTVSLPNGLTAATIAGDPIEKSPSELGENPSVSKPDQVFQVETPYVGIATGLNEGEPVVKPSVAGQQIGRKMLQVTVPSTIPGTVHLTGSGVSAGDSDLGAQANLYGQAESNGVTDTHVEPHGAQGAASVGGEQYATNAAVNPDCLGATTGRSEGSCVTVEPGRK